MARRGRVSPTRFHGATGFVLALLSGAGLMLLFRAAWVPLHLVAAWLAAINLTAFGYFGYDKACARAGARRVPEAVLYGLALAGGSAGAFAAMALFRHKTVKGRFRLTFWLIVVLQLAVCAWVASVLWRRHA